jgi:hypothetical protein
MPINDVTNVVLTDHPFMFRNDVGCGWVGGRELFAKKDGVIPVKQGQHILINSKRIHYGLYKGSGDYIGWTPVIITPEMIGQTVAVFTSIEEKTENDSMSNEQKNWFRRVKEAGGIAEIYKEMPSGAIERIREIL